MKPTPPDKQSLAGYYRWHARIYDATRWAFLFGRHDLVIRAAAHAAAPRQILEIGCGTGKNLVALARCFPEARIIGMDLSKDMLDRARPKLKKFGGRITLRHEAYQAPVRAAGDGFDLIILSYSLSMINPGFDTVLSLCKRDLGAGGIIAVVDFHETRWTWFRRWMGVNHVRMEGQVLACLREHFQSLTCHVRPGYGGLWRYVQFLGTAPA